MVRLGLIGGDGPLRHLRREGLGALPEVRRRPGRPRPRRRGEREPHPVEGARDDRVLRGALQLAEEFEVGTVVTMSGLPANPGDSFPAWITTVWPPENLQLLEHQWTVAVDYPIAAIAALDGAIHHVHAKDTRIEDRAAVTSRLETIPNERTDERAWNYVAVGTGHPDGVAFWARFGDALQDAGYDGPLSIENEDYALGQRESVALAVDTLRQALTARSAQAGTSR